MKHLHFLFVLIHFTSGTYFRSNNEGLTNLLVTSINQAKGLETDLDTNVSLLGLGSLYLKKLVVLDIHQKEVYSETTKKGVTAFAKLDVDLLIDSELKLFGKDIQKGVISLTMKGMKMELAAYLSASEQGQLLKKVDKFKKFHTGSVKLHSDSYIAKTLSQATLNVVLVFVKSTIKSELLKAINSFEIPKEVRVGDVTVPLTVVGQPQQEEGLLQIEFMCGHNKDKASSTDQSNESANDQNGLFINEDCFNSLLRQVSVNEEVIAQEISDIMEINSKTLGSVFPGFLSLERAMDVAIEISIHGIQTHLLAENAYLNFKIKCILYLVDTVQHDRSRWRKQPNAEGEYYTEFVIDTVMDLQLLEQAQGWVLSVEDMDILSLGYEDEEKIDEEEFWFLKDVGVKYGLGITNLFLYQQMFKIPSWMEVQVAEKGILIRI